MNGIKILTSVKNYFKILTLVSAGILFVFFAFVIVLRLGWGVRVLQNLTASLPLGNYFVATKNYDLANGDVVFLDIIHKDAHLLKIVGCKGGQMLKSERNKAFENADEVIVYKCDDEIITTHNATITNEANALNPAQNLTLFEFNGTLKENELFVYTPHPFSYDSRYIGFIDKSKVKGKILWKNAKDLRLQ